MDKAIQTTGRYSWEKKVEAASKYMQLGNMRLVSELIEVPYQTIADWRKTDWWKDLCDELKTAKKAKQSQKLKLSKPNSDRSSVLCTGMLKERIVRYTLSA